jgi:hypothetical protein
VVAVAVGGVGLWLWKHQPAMHGVSYALLAAGAAGIIALLLTLPIALSIDDARRHTLRHQEELLVSLGDRLQQISVLLNLISEQQLISDRAKSVAFREKDSEAVRRAIREDIAKADWDVAQALTDAMEKEFGYKAEADRFRQEIAGRKTEIVRRQVAEQMEAVDRYTKAEAWGQAFQEAQRIMVMFPKDEEVMKLPQEIEARRQTRKKQLLDQWHEAVNRHDVDGSIEILKRLDLYLTPAEAESMQETARGVFKEKLILLKTQFSMAVQDHRWEEAIRLGDGIMTEFPNSRMAQEVRDMMAMLRQRAGAEPPAAMARA